MFGILLYIYFLLIGYVYSCFVFKGKSVSHRIWMGCVFGNVILMMGTMLTSIVFNFTIISHIVLMILSICPALFLFVKNKRHSINTKEFFWISKDDEKSCLSLKVFWFMIIPIFLIIALILTNHILTPFSDGGYASGQSTYGDLQMHLGFVTSIAEQQTFPPNYIFLDGYKLNYPFFVDMLSSSLYLFGSSLRCAVLFPSYVMSLLLIVGFYMLSYKITANKTSSIVATIFFFLGGGFGFAYFLDGAKVDHTAFTKIFTDYYHTPTNFNEHNIRWANPICDMIVPQRTTMAGWFMFMPTCWLLIDALKTASKKSYITLAILAGCMPMIHTHTFLALGIISAVMFFAYLPSGDKKAYLINWVSYGAIVGVMAFPQLFYWVFSQTSGNSSFLTPHFNWVNHNDPYLWFYFKNWGIVALFALPAIAHASKDNKKLLLGVGVIFAIAELILFQPNEYDNNKLFFITYMILLIAVSDWLVYMYEKINTTIQSGKTEKPLKTVQRRTFSSIYLAVIIIFSATFSGLLTIGREYYSGGMYQTFDADKVAMADWIKENTDGDALFLTSTSHLNPITSLAGRNVYVGSSLYVSFHGMNEEFNKRNGEIKKAYEGSYNDLVAFCKEHNIKYVYIGSNEKNSNDFSLNPELMNKLKLVHANGAEGVYQVEN